MYVVCVLISKRAAATVVHVSLCASWFEGIEAKNCTSCKHRLAAKVRICYAGQNDVYYTEIGFCDYEVLFLKREQALAGLNPPAS